MKNWIKRIISNKYIFFGSSIKSNEIAMTFDDGPHPANTPKLLAILEKENIKTTFFCSGAECEKYPMLIKEIACGGHEIGNHSYKHKKLKEIGVTEYENDILRTNEIIYRNAGTRPRLFRAPYGELNMRIIKIVRSNKMILAGWTIDSNDSYLKDKKKLTDFINATPVRSGDILLFHEDYPDTIDAMQEIIKDLKSRGFRLVTMSRLLDKKQ